MATTGGADQERAQAVAQAALRQATVNGVVLPQDLRLWALAGDERPRVSLAVGLAGGDSAGERVVAGLAGDERPVVSLAAGLAGDELPVPGLAAVLEAATPPAQRRANGLHVTPGWLADQLVALALDGRAAPPPDDVTVCDPACGGGAFLLSAARALHASGVPRLDVVRRLWGADVDPVGLAAAEAELALWAGEPPPPGHLVVGDPLAMGASLWSEAPAKGFAAVVGNPPFLNQLGRATARSPVETGRLRQRFGDAVLPYTDTAWLFLLLGCELVHEGGRVAMVQPMSLAAARDAAAVRSALSQRAELRHLWVEAGRSFAAGVKVCAPVLEVRRRRRSPATVRDGDGSSWADRLADAIGVPRVDLGVADRAGAPVRRLGERATVLAGFRDEYYGLVPLVREAESAGEQERPLVTAGVIDWGRCAWGERPSRFAKQPWAAPVVDLSQLTGRRGEHRRNGRGGERGEDDRDGRGGERDQDDQGRGGERDQGDRVGRRGERGEDDRDSRGGERGEDDRDGRRGERDQGDRRRGGERGQRDRGGGGGGRDQNDVVARAAARWVVRTAVPKIVVATQTRVVEAAVDQTGTWVPSVPTLAVLPERPEDLWPLAAALAAPTATAWLLRRAPETGLSRGALKIAARDLADLPLPVDAPAWEAATAALRAYVEEPTEAHLDAFAQAAAVAYEAPESLVDWWRQRLG